MSNRFLSEVLPKQLLILQDNRKKLEWKQREISDELNYSEHDCDCEYCDKNDYEFINEDRREELEADFDKNKQEIKDITAAIDRAISYREFMKKKVKI